MELENIILSEVTQTQIDNYHMYSLIGGFETYRDRIYLGSRNRHALLSKLGAWGLWERVEGEGKVREGIREKCRTQ